MLAGLMQETPLQISSLLCHAAANHGTREIVTRTVEGPIHRYDYAQADRRARRLARVLMSLGVEPGDRVASLAWNTHRHVELFFAVPGVTAVLHTVNPRLFDEQIVYILNHAGAKILFVDLSLLALVERLKPKLTWIRQVVVLTDEAHRPAASFPLLCYEDLLADADESFDWPEIDERAAAMLCYTSGTTGEPKGVLYSHRSIVLHALGTSLPDALGISAEDVLLPGASLYHAAAWGIPYIAALNGAKLVLPGEKLDGASLHALIESEGVTVSFAVPTVWTTYLAHLESTGARPSRLKRLFSGGSAVPPSLIETFRARFGIEMIQLWGMTEMSPIGVVCRPAPALDRLEPAARAAFLAARAGRILYGVEMKTVDDDGRCCPRDGLTVGAVKVRGPWVLRQYFNKTEPLLEEGGWFDTGDVGALDENGFLRITDRQKDLIKSGGEWISSVDLENAAMGHPDVHCAAVIGAAHPKWAERPVLILVAVPGRTVTRAQMLSFLSDRVVKWWLPDDVVVVPEIPLTATGKIDKKLLRARYKDHLTAAQGGVKPA